MDRRPAFPALSARWALAREIERRLSRRRADGPLPRRLLRRFLRCRAVALPAGPEALRPALQFAQMCRNAEIEVGSARRLHHHIDIHLALCEPSRGHAVGNVTADYSRFANEGFRDLERRIAAERARQGDTSFLDGVGLVVEGMRDLARRTRQALARLPERDPELLDAFDRMEEGPAATFHQALQRILFLSQVLWQWGHPLVGLGRLDQTLGPFLDADFAAGRIDRELAGELLREFLLHLHRDFEFKSNILLGDTGQIIVVGGLLPDGTDACNELTALLLEVVGELGRPDPKLLFRIGGNTPRRFLELASDCLARRTGSPLLSNDEVVVPLLERAGFSRQDARGYATAACWEPLVPGRSLDQGNIGGLCFPAVLGPALDALDRLESPEDFESLVARCEERLASETTTLLDRMDRTRWKPSPILSLFMDDCLARSRDISEGGAARNDYGFTTVGLGNLVDSLLNLRELVVARREIDLVLLQEAMRRDFRGFEELRESLRRQPLRHGRDEEEPAALANRLSSAVAEAVDGRRNRFGGRFKFGFSSPAYLMDAGRVAATPDGRASGEPFLVHISSSVPGLPPTELVRFAGRLDYDRGRHNGNVVDLVLDPQLVDGPSARFADFLEGAVRSGFFQMQMTVVDSATLRAAIEDPDRFPDLVVRVWGFSAYFRDLPPEYRRLVLERALQGEAARR